MRRIVKRHAPVLLLFAVLAVVMTWPLARNLPSAVANTGDPLINTWILDWDWHATIHHPASLFQADAFYPAKYALAFSENLYGIALFLFPLRAAGVGAVAAMNTAMLLGFALCGFVAYLLGWYVTRSTAAGVAAGVFYAFVPFRFGHLSQVQFVWGWPLALLLLALLHYARRPSPATAALFALAFVLNGLANIHALLFGSIAIAVTALLLWPRWRPLLAATAVAVILLLPFLIPYWRASKLYGMKRSAEEAMHYSAAARDWLHVPLESRLYARWLNDPKNEPERNLFPGVLAIGLAIFAMFAVKPTGAPPRTGAPPSRRLERRLPAAASTAGGRMPPVQPAGCRRSNVLIGAIWVLLGFLGSLGLNTFFHRVLFDYVPGFRAIRVPARWAIVSYVGLALLIAIGTSMLARVRWLVVALLLLELRAAPLCWQLLPSDTPPVYRWLASARPHAVLELPRDQFADYVYLLAATTHHQRIANGVSGFVPPELKRLDDLIHAKPVAPELLGELRRIGVDTLVVHGDRADAETRAWLQREHPEFVARFDSAEGSGDWVFRTGAGPLPSGPLAAFLRGEPTYNSSTFGALQFPQIGETILHGAFFSGYALSPYGIRRVDLLFDNGGRRYPATLAADAGLSRLLPWYDATPKPRFFAGFATRPRDVREVTDVQVEIEDGNGRVTRLLSHPFRWP